MVKLFSLKSPDEWATTKQACRDTYVVTCFLPSTIRIYLFIFFFIFYSTTLEHAVAFVPGHMNHVLLAGCGVM